MKCLEEKRKGLSGDGRAGEGGGRGAREGKRVGIARHFKKLVSLILMRKK